jgi:hypothetical protein
LPLHRGLRVVFRGKNCPPDSVVIRREPDRHEVGREPGTPAVDQAERSVA